MKKCVKDAVYVWFFSLEKKGIRCGMNHDDISCPWTPKTHENMKVVHPKIWDIPYRDIPPKNEGNVGSHGGLMVDRVVLFYIPFFHLTLTRRPLLGHPHGCGCWECQATWCWNKGSQRVGGVFLLPFPKDPMGLVYSPPFFSWFLLVDVVKYTSPMDPMGLGLTRFPFKKNKWNKTKRLWLYQHQ